MKRIFLNASKNTQGNTSRLAGEVFRGLEYTTINLVERRIDQIGQQSDGDEYFAVIEELAHADILVIGTPVYWSSMTGYLKTFIDRLADTMDMPLDSPEAPLRGAVLYLIVQGTAPEDAIPGISTVIEHVARRFFMDYRGLIRNSQDAQRVNQRLG